MKALSVFALLAGLVLARSDTLRGINPDLATHYSGTGGTFTCVSGISKTIPFSRVNDDYCDCPDGSDEPGTSACHNGRFYCQNLGHEPSLLASAYVDDGICDCCDGADEAKGKCKNTCLEASAVRKEALQNKIALHEFALNTKANYIARAHSFKEELNLKAGTIDDDIVKQQAEVARLKEEVKHLEEEEEASRKVEEERVAEELAEQQADTDEDSIEEDGLETATGGHEERELLQDSQGAQPEEREETPEERGRRIASQWTNDPEAAAVPGSQDAVSEDDNEEDVAYDGEDNRGDYDHGTDLAAREHTRGELEHMPPRPEATTPLGEARARLYDAERLIETMQKDKDNIVTYLYRDFDYGPDNVFLAFAGKCFTSYQTRWTYEVCAFKDAVQKEGYSNSVTVGRWQGFSEDYKNMLFTGGDECWNVGPRSMTVSLSCGLDERLSDGEEPATCAYAAKLETPAVCTDTELEELKQQLRNIEMFEKEVQAKLAKDEL